MQRKFEPYYRCTRELGIHESQTQEEKMKVSIHYKNGEVTNLEGSSICYIEINNKIIWYSEVSKLSLPYLCDSCIKDEDCEEEEHSYGGRCTLYSKCK